MGLLPVFGETATLRLATRKRDVASAQLTVEVLRSFLATAASGLAFGVVFEAAARVSDSPTASQWRRWSEGVRKVLVVDDESNMRFLLRMTLESGGFEVVEAHHGAAALERVKQEEPDLVVTDLMMPVMNGRELVARLRADAETAGIPIIVLSANASVSVAGADAAFRKPFEIEALLDTARSLSRKDSA